MLFHLGLREGKRSYSKSQIVTGVGEDAEKLEPSYTADGNIQ